MYGLVFSSFCVRSPGANGEKFVDLCHTYDADFDYAAAAAALPDDDLSTRYIRYGFDPSFLDCTSIGAALTMHNGPRELKDLQLVERHYFRNKLIKSFEFTFPYVIPSSTNTWEMIYDVPKISSDDSTFPRYG